MPQSQNRGCLGILLGLFAPGKPAQSPPTAPTFPYGLRDHFLSAAEQSFFQVLKGVIGPDLHLITKVRLSDLFFVRQPHLNKGARNMIDRKHVDFVLCDASTMQPVLGIELDDASHQRKNRQQRDEFVDQVFAAAQLPLLHIPAARGYQPEQLAARINTTLHPPQGEPHDGAQAPPALP